MYTLFFFYRFYLIPILLVMSKDPHERRIIILLGLSWCLHMIIVQHVLVICKHHGELKPYAYGV